MSQMLLFDCEKTPSQEIATLKAAWEKTRKSQFAQISELKKMYTELSHEHEILKLHICKGKLL